jgi:NAD(P)H-hydrate repair Nnr-like enzyme with NAD(P)H-hydrate dehydratase domain
VRAAYICTIASGNFSGLGAILALMREAFCQSALRGTFPEIMTKKIGTKNNKTIIANIIRVLVIVIVMLLLANSEMLFS